MLILRDALSLISSGISLKLDSSNEAFIIRVGTAERFSKGHGVMVRSASNGHGNLVLHVLWLPFSCVAGVRRECCWYDIAVVTC